MINREQRRALKDRFQIPKTISFTPAELDAKLNVVKQKAYRNGCDDGVRLSMGIMLMACLDGGFIPKENTQAAFQKIIYLSDSVKRRYLDPQDLYDTLKSDYDIEL